MGVSRDAILCYGINVPEGKPLPWFYGDEMEMWWSRECGFRPTMEIYNAYGWPLAHTTEEDKDLYFEEWHEFEKKQPKLPVELVIHCHYDCPMYIIAIPGTVTVAVGGTPQPFDLYQTKVYPNDVVALRDFCAKYSIPGKEGWWLVSRWG